jgi:deoxyribose-phosphate aldolase
MADPNLDQIVEEITRRVEMRLAPNASQAPCIKRPDVQPSNEDCDACQGCHVHRPDDVRNIVQLGAARIAAGVGHDAPAADLAAVIDHTLLKPDATREQLKKVCDEAKRYGFATVCVNASNVRFCASQLRGSSTVPIAVVGFPLGAATPSAKAFEAREAIRNGAMEIDTVVNLGALKSKDYASVQDDIAAVVAASSPKPVKVILETASLSYDEKVIVCVLSKVAGAAFVKTSTGFGGGGATAEDIALMRRIVGPKLGVKASGGVRSIDDARAMLKAGATRLGASASVEIVSGQKGSAKGSQSKVKAGGY